MSTTLEKIGEYHKGLSEQLKRHPEETQKQVLNSLDATKNAGHAPRNLARTLTSGLDSKAITHKTLPDSITHLQSALEETKNAGHDPRHLADGLSSGLYSKAITEKTLPNLLELAKDPPKQGKRDGIDQIIIHGVVAHRDYRIPADMISSYQRKFLDAGHFPSAYLLYEYGANKEATRNEHIRKRRDRTLLHMAYSGTRRPTKRFRKVA